MRRQEFLKYLARDGGCYHCGDTERPVPNHRANRGMGGSKERDTPSNIVTICFMLNGLIESDAGWARVAREYGWKLETWQDPATSPVYDFQTNAWYLLNDDYARVVTSNTEGKHVN